MKVLISFLEPVARVIVLLFYSKAQHASALKVLASVFFMQKIIGFNRFVGWPCHFTSKIIAKNNIELGSRTFPGWSPGCYIQAKNGIRIGNNLRMGPGVSLVSANHNLDDYDIWDECDPIVIGSNVWLGAGVVVMPGVKIGDNVVIAANAVVTKSVPSNTVAGGVPCEVIKEKSTYKGRAFTS